MIFYNLSVYLAFRDPNYILYVIFIALFGVLQSHFLGYSFQYLWPIFPWFQERAIGVFIGFTISAGGYFVDRYLGARARAPTFQSSNQGTCPGGLCMRYPFVHTPAYTCHSLGRNGCNPNLHHGISRRFRKLAWWLYTRGLLHPRLGNLSLLASSSSRCRNLASLLTGLSPKI